MRLYPDLGLDRTPPPEYPRRRPEYYADRARLAVQSMRSGIAETDRYAELLARTPVPE